jgi:hypothetical protein
MLMKLRPHSLATALANMVFPVPGGPNNSNLTVVLYHIGGCIYPDLGLIGMFSNSFGYFAGHSNVSLRVLLIS